MSCSGLEVIKLEYSLKLKIKRSVRKQPIIALYFEFENEPRGQITLNYAYY